MVNFKLSCLFVITVVMNRLHERNVSMPCSRYAAGERLRERDTDTDTDTDIFN